MGGTPGHIGRGSLIEQVKRTDRPAALWRAWEEAARGPQGCETRVSPSVQVLCLRRGVRE